jgi:hypothetical protein
VALTSSVAKPPGTAGSAADAKSAIKPDLDKAQVTKGLKELDAEESYWRMRAHTYKALRLHDLPAYRAAGVSVTSAEGDAYAEPRWSWT